MKPSERKTAITTAKTTLATKETDFRTIVENSRLELLAAQTTLKGLVDGCTHVDDSYASAVIEGACAICGLKVE